MCPDSSGDEHPIVVGLDGSDVSKQALVWAAQQARMTGAPLHAVMTWELPNYGWVTAWPEDIDLEADAKTALHNEIVGVFNGAPPVEITELVVEGHAALVLVDLSEDASLLVVGSRGHGAFAGMILGSVSAHVVSHAHCPVVVVHDPSPHDGT